MKTTTKKATAKKAPVKKAKAVPEVPVGVVVKEPPVEKPDNKKQSKVSTAIATVRATNGNRRR